MRRTTASAGHHRSSLRALARATAIGAMLMLLFVGCGGEAGTAAADDASAAAAREPIVDTTYGKVRGAIADGIYTFKGIPYGASTAGAGRFKPPAKPAAWEGVRDALVYGNRAPQATLTRGGRRRLRQTHPLVRAAGRDVRGLPGLQRLDSRHRRRQASGR